MTNEEKVEIAQAVREAIASLPPFENMTLTVEEKGVYKTDIAGQVWWRAPVVPQPVPRRMVSLYEAMSEIEFFLEDERGLPIDLVTGHFDDPKPLPVENLPIQQECRECITEERKAEIAQMVRDAIAETPIRDGRRLEVDEQAIEAWPTGNIILWDVPVVTTPAPRRRSQMDATFFAIEDRLRAERGITIVLDTETSRADVETPEPALLTAP